VLVGSPGAGKTTAIMKLALEFGIKRGRTVEILSMHRGRPEVNSALETMTGLLGIRTQTLTSVEALEPALARPRATGTLVLVDTNGYGSGSIDDDRGFASMVDSEQAAEVHLVLPAAWHPTSLRQAVDRFEIFHPTRLLYTMVDQAAVFGPMIEEPLRTGKGLSFAGSGPAGSGTLLPISLQWLLGRIWESSEERTR
jgi:flagellar biosynthesis GTPase FlhF